MGVPDFLKFVVRHAPSSLYKVPHGKETDDNSVHKVNLTSHLCYDYVLIDATNVFQTIGLEKVYAFLTNNFVQIKHGVIFALDSERNRTGASRFYRQTHLLVSDLAVKINEMCVKLQKHYEERHKLHLSACVPLVAVSGREVAGEADYKILDIQRGLILASMCTVRALKPVTNQYTTESNELVSQQSSLHASCSLESSELNVEIPKFLFITEDSDVLCGVLCGPFPQKCSIVTTLHDVLYELSILRVEQVMLYIANCVQALSTETRQMFKENKATMAKHSNQIADLSQDCSIDKGDCKNHNVDDKSSSKCENSISAGTFSTTTTMAASNNNNDSKSYNVQESKDVDIVRRRKVDGPMIATGTRVEFADSESDNDESCFKVVNSNDDIDIDSSKVDKSSIITNKQPSMTTSWPREKADKASVINHDALQNKLKSSTEVLPRTATSCATILASLTPYERAVGQIIHSSCVDLVFLFVLVMGDGVRVPPLMPGVTKIDIGSCWKVYCDNKYSNLKNECESTLGRCLIKLNNTATESNIDRSNTIINNNEKSFSSLTQEENVLVAVNCHFLNEILSQVHYADVQPRAMSEEEEHRAAVYLSHAVYSVFHYTVACNMESSNKLQHSFLDMRHLMEVNIQAPSLTAVLQLLARQPQQMYSFALHGVPSRLECHVVDSNASNHRAVAKDKVENSNSKSDKCQNGFQARQNVYYSNKNNNNNIINKGNNNYFNNSSNCTRELKLDVRNNLCAPLTTVPVRQRLITESAMRGVIQTSHSRMCTLSDFIYGYGSSVHSEKRQLDRLCLMSIKEQISKIAKEWSDSKIACLPLHTLNDRHNKCNNLYYYMQLLWSFSVGVSTDALWGAVHGEKGYNTSESVNNNNINVVHDDICGSSDCTNDENSNKINVDGIKNSKSATETNRTKYVYSFELRRMVPIYVSDKNNINYNSSGIIDCKSGANSAATAEDAHNTHNRQGTLKAIKSVAQDALLQALGVSLDYANQSSVDKKEIISTKRHRSNNDSDESLKNSNKRKKVHKEHHKYTETALTKNTSERCSAMRADHKQKSSPSQATLTSSLSPELNAKALPKSFVRNKTAERAEQIVYDANNIMPIESIHERKEKSKKAHYRPGRRERRLLRRNASNTNK